MPLSLSDEQLANIYMLALIKDESGASGRQSKRALPSLQQSLSSRRSCVYMFCKPVSLQWISACIAPVHWHRHLRRNSSSRSSLCDACFRICRSPTGNDIFTLDEVLEEVGLPACHLLEVLDLVDAWLASDPPFDHLALEDAWRAAQKGGCPSDIGPVDPVAYDGISSELLSVCQLAAEVVISLLSCLSQRLCSSQSLATIHGASETDISLTVAFSRCP